MLELATLGLLQQTPLNGYRLKQQLEQFMGCCISVNYGTIYPLLKRLEQGGFISVQPDADRKLYSITEQGRILWKQKMLEHPHESWVNAQSRFAIKFFFFSHLTPIERQKLLEHRLMICRLRLEERHSQDISTDRYQQALWHCFASGLEKEIFWLKDRLNAEYQPPAIESVRKSEGEAYSHWAVLDDRAVLDDH